MLTIDWILVHPFGFIVKKLVKYLGFQRWVVHVCMAIDFILLCWFTLPTIMCFVEEILFAKEDNYKMIFYNKVNDIKSIVISFQNIYIMPNNVT